MSHKIPYFPSIQKELFAHEGRVEYSTYVRIKRGRKWYRVLVRDSFMLPEYSSTRNNSSFLPAEACLFRFVIFVYQTIHLYQINKSKMVATMGQMFGMMLKDILNPVDELQISEEERLKHEAIPRLMFEKVTER